MLSKKMEVADIFFLAVKNPCVRWPPSGRSSPMMRPWGSTRAVYTAKLPEEPLYAHGGPSGLGPEMFYIVFERGYFSF